jgi:hypothetical protein
MLGDGAVAERERTRVTVSEEGGGITPSYFWWLGREVKEPMLVLFWLSVVE